MLFWMKYARNHFCVPASVLIAGFAALSPCLAHQKWLWPNRFSADAAPVWISFDVSWSDRPFEAEEGVNDRPLVIVSPAGRSFQPARSFVGKTKSTAEIECKETGTFRLESIDPLTYWTQIEKDGRPQWLKKSKNEVTGEKITRADLYWSKALAYVSVGKSTAPSSLDGDPLAIVPTTHPNEIDSGQSVEFKVLSYGTPVANAEIKVFDSKASGHDPTATIKCNDAGIGQFEFTSAGRYLVACQLEREVKDDPKADIHSFNVYLTLQIRNGSK
jgi:uncharacterized GH25 family protein